MNPMFVTDCFWVITLLAMGIFCVLLIRIHLRPSAAHWFGMLICASAVNIMGVILTDLVNPEYPLGWRAISLGRAFIPYCMLGFSLVFPYRRRIARSGPALHLLAVPSLITLVITDPCFAREDIAEQLWYLVPWMGVYFLWSYLNLFLSFRRTRLRATRRQHALLCMASVPTTAMHYTTSILLPAFGVDELWRFNWVPILIAFIVFLIASIRFGTVRRYARLSRSLLNKSIIAAGLSSQMVTHTVKNTLQLIRSLAESASGQGSQEIRNGLSRIIHLCDELAERMNKLNLLNRGSLCQADECFPINEPLDKAVEKIEPHLGQVTVSRSFEGPIPIIRGERMHLQEVFYNLLLNAIEAMPNGGAIRLEIGIENDLAVVGLHDQGPGIESEQLTKIFEPFRTTKGSEMNWGIGLSYCHLVMVRLGGDLFIESTPGVGSSFFVVMPLTGLGRKPWANRPLVRGVGGLQASRINRGG